MKLHYGSDHTSLKLKGKAFKAYSNLGIDIYEYTDRAYHILPEYQHLWGEDANDETIIWGCELAYYADEWETTESDLLDQLEEFPLYDIPGYVDHLMTKDELINWLEDGVL